jgi:hypothetical protein
VSDRLGQELWRAKGHCWHRDILTEFVINRFTLQLTNKT